MSAKDAMWSSKGLWPSMYPICRPAAVKQSRPSWVLSTEATDRDVWNVEGSSTVEESGSEA